MYSNNDLKKKNDEYSFLFRSLVSRIALCEEPVEFNRLACKSGLSLA